MAKSIIFKLLCASFVAGIFIDSVASVPLPALLVTLIVSVSLIALFSSKKRPVVFGFCLAILSLAVFLHQEAEKRVFQSELQLYNLGQIEISLEGVSVSEPDLGEKRQQFRFQPDGVDGKILVTASLYPLYNYGDRLKIKGRVEKPSAFDGFDYGEYLAKDGIYSVMYYPEIELVREGEGNFIFSEILLFKGKLRESIYKNLSPPHSLILGALVLGDKNRMSSELKEKLNAAGVRHITAVSGMHVVIITSILAAFFLGIGISAKKSSILSLIMVALFISLTGFQASAVRAGIMGGFLLAAQFLGREKNSLNFLIFAAVLMLYLNPLLLSKDVGFQLSFLAVLGISYFLPFFKDLFSRAFKTIPNVAGFKDILAMTFSAQVFTLPVLVYNFGQFSLISPITNVLIIPVLTLVMALGFASGILGMIFSQAGWILSLPLWVLLDYVLKVVDFSLFAYLDTGRPHWIWFLAIYCFLGFILWRFNRKRREEAF